MEIDLILEISTVVFSGFGMGNVGICGDGEESFADVRDRDSGCWWGRRRGGGSIVIMKQDNFLSGASARYV